MKITLISVGKIKEKFFKQAIEEYSKRLTRYCNLNIIEVLDEKAPENLSDLDRENVLQKEGEKILSKIPANCKVITMEIDGVQMTSEELAARIEKFALNGYSHICFIIGGSLGLSHRVKNVSHMRLSFSPMTFPHQLFRVMVLEQVYRAFKIMHGEPYHK